MLAARWLLFDGCVVRGVRCLFVVCCSLRCAGCLSLLVDCCLLCVVCCVLCVVWCCVV